MKKTYTEIELKELSKKVFEQFPNAKVVFAVEDGNIFLSEHRARAHAGKDKVYAIEKDGDSEDSKQANTSNEVKLSAPERVAKIQEATTPEELELFKGDKAKTVQEAYELKLQELQKAEEAISTIKSAQTVEELDPFKEDERAAVKEAYQVRLQELQITE